MTLMPIAPAWLAEPIDPAEVAACGVRACAAASSASCWVSSGASSGGVPALRPSAETPELPAPGAPAASDCMPEVADATKTIRTAGMVTAIRRRTTATLRRTTATLARTRVRHGTLCLPPNRLAPSPRCGYRVALAVRGCVSGFRVSHQIDGCSTGVCAG